MSTQPALSDLARMIDHSLLHPTMTQADLVAGCALARRYQVATVCIKPYAVSLAQSELTGSGVGVCTVIGFPHGNSMTAIKVMEAELAVAGGAGEIDMVVNHGWVLGGQWEQVEREIGLIQDAVSARGAILKVIFENDFLQETHIARLCRICTDLQVAFVKTSTGYGYVRQPDGAFRTLGATDAHLRLMRAESGPRVQIKAAGGVRTLDDLLRVRSLGVTRIGATATAAILDAAIARGLPGAATFLPAGLSGLQAIPAPGGY
jgi:deoxyribose-phosphate aldolase